MFFSNIYYNNGNRIIDKYKIDKADRDYLNRYYTIINKNKLKIQTINFLKLFNLNNFKIINFIENFEIKFADYFYKINDYIKYEKNYLKYKILFLFLIYNFILDMFDIKNKF